ncbi:hypothetical protein PVK06_027657 [Gossypium arboreum]|uniref:SWIM-type domain-containing protein n=1 Tax=Gossypium arboreum TaxID=29729 RepID=A0ABR0P0U6_GOSAR|nr:hypothetical protein PVK06_027657 [Gossypium arboreum]
MLGASYRVDLSERACDCEWFQVLWFPCAHLIIACGSLRIEYTPYINCVYRLWSMHSVWNPEFPSILDKSTWAASVQRAIRVGTEHGPVPCLASLKEYIIGIVKENVCHMVVDNSRDITE